MPFLLVLDFTCLTFALALSAGLVLSVSGAGLDKPMNRSFVLFTSMESGFVVCAVLLRIALFFKVGSPERLLQAASMFFALTAPFLLLFCLRATRIRGRGPGLLVVGVVAAMLGLLFPLLQGRLVSSPSLGPSGLVMYHVHPLGVAFSVLPAACLAAAFVVAVALWRRERSPAIVVSVGLLLGGFIAGGVAEPQLPLTALTSAVSVGVLGWGIVRRQVFNPLRELAADLRERAHRQELIAQISSRTARLLRLDELLGQAATLIRSSFDYFTVAVFLVSGDELVLRASTHEGASAYIGTFRLKVGKEGICGWVAASGRPLVVGDVGRDPRYVSLLDPAMTKSELAVPILRRDRVIGVLDVQSSVPHAFSHKDVLTQQTIADQLSAAIENTSLYEETQRRAERLTVVNRISAAAGTVLDLDDLLETVHREVTAIFKADAFFIALLERDNETLDFRFQVDEGHRDPPVREPIGAGLTSHVVRTGKPLLVNDFGLLNESSTITPLPWGTGKVPTSWIGVPMLLGDQLIGVMSVQTYSAHHYDAEDMLLATTIADQVSVAVENARLYEKVTRELDVRLRTEKVLRESEEKFRNLAEQSPNIIFIYARRRVVYVNRQCETSLGYRQEVVCAPEFDLRVLTTSGADGIAAQAFRRLLEGQEVPPYELVLITRAGKRIDAILTTRLIGYDGAPSILGIVTDITARKRTERLLQSLNAATLAMEQALTPAEVFPSAVRVLSGVGFDSAVFMKTDGGAFAGAKENDGSPAEVVRALRIHCRGNGTTGEVRITTGDDAAAGGAHGGAAVSLLSADAARDVAQAMDGRGALYCTLDRDDLTLFFGNGKPAVPGGAQSSGGVMFAPLVVEEEPFGLLVVAGQDLGPEDLQVFTAFAHQAAAAWRKTRLVRDLERSLEKLNTMQEQLLHSQKMEAIGRLAGGIAHDFNNLLTVISGYTSILSDNLEGNAPALADLGQIRTTIKRASALTGRLLTFSRKQILQPVVLDLNKVVANSVTLLRPLIGEDIELLVRLSANALWVRADQGQVDQVLMNLAVNARDAMPGGGKLVLETFGADHPDAAPLAPRAIPPGLPAGPWALLRVQDDGVGMSEDTRAHIFEPFFTTKEEGKGSGLGLSTVYGIVTQAGGRITVDSATGRGSLFTIALPRVQPTVEHHPVEEIPRQMQPGSGTVLLVEDEADVRELATRVLERGGYHVVGVASAKEALLVAEGSTQLDMVVTDVVMPGGMSGVEMGDRLSRTRPDLPVLYVSGYTDPTKFSEPTGSRGLNFLGKPFQPHELLSRVKTMMSRAPRRGPS